MATEKIDIEVAIKENFKTQKSAYENTMSNRGVDKKAKQDLELIYKKLEAAAKLNTSTEAGQREYSRAARTFEQAIQKATAHTITPEQQKNVESRMQVEKELAEQEQRRLQLAKKFSATNKNNYRDSELIKNLTGAKIVNSKTGKELSADSFIKGLKSNKNPQQYADQRIITLANGTSMSGTDWIQNQTVQAAQDKAKISNYDNIISGLKNQVQDLKAQSVEIKGDNLYLQVANANLDLNNALNEEKIQKELTQNSGFDTGGISASDITANTNIQSSGLGKAFKGFTAYALVINTLKKAAREAVQTITELDKSLTEQAMVTSKTREQTYALLTTYQNMSIQLGATTKEVASVATEYMRQGKTVQDSLTLTEAAISAAKVANISASDSINYLTTALNGFQLSASDAMIVSDKFAAVAATSATDYEELAVALSKVASQANLAGMSIDYTTALLAKGIETTREAPETIGTALKTVIARMREISDYGETLEGDTDVNNVETQLNYVGIALKNANGELRSTEDVLDELGKKWDTLNTNQQAAIAKALAGTRQQSRLIAMMSDYDRVLELQAVAQEATGATVAQMNSYLTGMEAALNKVSVAWEKIVTNLTDSDFVIGLVNMVGNILDKVGEIFENEAAVKTVTIATVAVLAVALGQKTQSLLLAKQQQKLQQQELIAKQKGNITSQKNLVLQKATEKSLAAQLVAQLEKEKSELKSQQAAGTLTVEGQARLTAIDEEIKKANQKLVIAEDEYTTESAKLNLLEKSTTYLENQTSIWGVLQNSATGFLSILFAIPAAIQMIGRIKRAEDAKSGATSTASAAATIISQLGVWGIPIASAVVAVLAAALGSGAAILSGLQSTSVEDQINNSSSTIYNLSTQNTQLQNLISSYDELDQKIIKTASDQEEMATTLEEAADKLSDSDKEIYNSLSTNSAKKEFLETVIKKNQEQIQEERLKQISLISSTNSSALLTSSSSDALKVQDAVKATANSYMYDYVSALTDLDSSAISNLKTFAQTLIEQSSALEMFEYIQNPEKIKQFIDSIKNATTVIDGEETALAQILQSDDYSISQKVNAYRELIQDISDPVFLKAFNEYYSDISALSDWGDGVLSWIDKMKISAKSINDISEVLVNMGYEASQTQSLIEQLFAAISSGVTVSDAIASVFGNLSDSDYNKILNAYGSATTVGTLNVGQDLLKLRNQIDSLYEKAQSWSSLSTTEQSEFLSDNAELFSGEKGAQLWKAFESGDYATIKKTLMASSIVGDVGDMIQEIEQELAVEEARTGDDYNATYIQWLKEQKAYLEDAENYYAASLETRLQQEENYLSEYKKYLEEQKTALTDSLDDRKQAYEDYFSTVNEQADTEDFEEQENTLISNITKLSTSTSAAAINKVAELEDSLKDLEEERLQTLRENAQQAILDEIDDQIDEINDKFDDLLDSQSMMLALMTEELSDPQAFLSNLIASRAASEGLTELGAQDLIEELKTTFGWNTAITSLLDGITFSNEGGNTILNVNGQEINLTNSEQQTIFSAINDALKSIGKK